MSETDKDTSILPTPSNSDAQIATQGHEVILIGRPVSPITDASERLLDGFILAMQDFDTETLLAIADDRDEINPDGWMQKCIRGYVEVWR